MTQSSTSIHSDQSFSFFFRNADSGGSVSDVGGDALEGGGEGGGGGGRGGDSGGERGDRIGEKREKGERCREKGLCSQAKYALLRSTFNVYHMHYILYTFNI
jgi:hypothetical protein